MHFVVTLVTIENIFVLTCESQVALHARKGGHVVFVDAVFLGHDVEADADTLPDHVDLGTALWTLVHLPLRLFLGLVLVTCFFFLFLSQTLSSLLRCIVPFGLVTGRVNLILQLGGCRRCACRRHDMATAWI